ncbi:hypothetical protein ACOCJ5_05005 [Knoellia sp. CPCC 206450]|uniref:hypothetical protein n=1 Tax=Knoellia tibetensis TaxID=3404798 RepID=UPI003B432047
MLDLTTMRRGLAVTGVAAMMSLGFAGAAAAETNADNPNTPEYWEEYLEDKGYMNVDCEKLHDEGLDTDVWESDGDYVLVVLKAGSEQSSDGDSRTLHWDVEEGEEVATEDGKDISHIIACTGEKETSTPTPTPTMTPTPPPPGGPIVETDIPASGSDTTTPAILGGAAVLAGLGLAAGAMRRKGQH